MPYALLALAIVAEVTATLSLRASEGLLLPAWRGTTELDDCESFVENCDLA